MKLSLISLFLLCFTVTKAQLLKLKKNQKFSYEVSQARFYSSRQLIPNISYTQFDFEVIKASKGEYLLRVTEPLIIESIPGKITNTRFPLEEQGLTAAAVINKQLSESTYFVGIDEQSNIKNVTGIDSIKSDVLKSLKRLNVTEKWQSHADMAKNLLSDAAFKRRLQTVFPKSSVQEKDSMNTVNGKITKYETVNNKGPVEKQYETLDTMYLEQRIGKELKTGLLISFLADTKNIKHITNNGTSEYSRKVEKVNLLSSNIKALGTGPQLLEETKKTLDFDNYYTPAYAAARRVDQLREKYLESKGKVGIDKEIQQELDVMDKSFTPSDYRYWAARMDIAGHINDDGYKRFYAMVPYEYINTAFHVLQKMEVEYAKHNYENFNKGLDIIFTRFGEEDLKGYPMNMHVLDDLVHLNIAKEIFSSSNPDSIYKVFNLIKGTEQLNNERINAVFTALKAYTTAKLTSNKEDLVALTTINLNGRYDKHSRYRLLIYDELAKKNIADSIRTAYLDYTIEQLKNQISNMDLAEELPINRKYLADAYYRKSLADKKSGLSYLGLASDYMPNLNDRTHNSGTLSKEYKFLPYLNYTELLIAQSGNGKITEEQRLEKLVDLVIIEPERYTLLKEKYQKSFPKGDFKVFFNKTLKAKLPAIPEFSLTEISGKILSKKDQQDKFIFVDFWGTWCGACVQEIHKIDELYLHNKQPEKLLVTTIACYDNPENVKEFMKLKKYSYPVLMSDKKVEVNFNVNRYPTKLLLLPNGTYLDIPYGKDYQAVLDKYLSWDL